MKKHIVCAAVLLAASLALCGASLAPAAGAPPPGKLASAAEEQRLQERALRVGQYLADGLRRLMGLHRVIGDVRGSGLFLGVELVRDRDTREGAPEEATYVVNRLRECGILSGTDGPRHNVLKLRPPLIVSEADADLFVGTLGPILEEDAASV